MPEEKQRKSIRTAELDKMINKLRSLDRVDGTSEYYKNNAIAFIHHPVYSVTRLVR